MFANEYQRLLQGKIRNTVTPDFTLPSGCHRTARTLSESGVDADPGWALRFPWEVHC